MAFACKYIALHVPDLRTAEGFYRQVFGVEVLFRETERDGEWWEIRTERAWEDVEAAGVGVHMVALGREDLVLAFFRREAGPGALYEVSIALAPDEIDMLRARPPSGMHVLEEADDYLRFEDTFGLRWVLQPPKAEFRSSGQIAGRWLDV